MCSASIAAMHPSSAILRALSAESAANEAVNVRKLLGSSPELVPKPPVQSARFGAWPSSRSPNCPQVVAFSRRARLGLPVRAPLYGRPFKCRKCDSLEVTLFAATGRGSRLNVAFSAASATYPRSGCRGHAWEASRARGATFRCCRPGGASRQADEAPQYAALGDRLCVPSRS